MPTLNSAGVAAFVNDVSIYASPNPTTIPLVVFATRANKTAPDGSGIAAGTAESNKLRIITSQRELLLSYGNPVFVTSDGEPVHGDETNEYGLFALWSFLGMSNFAYVIRANIDLGQLVPSTQEPVLPPPDGTYWINPSKVVGGIFKYDGTNWSAVPFTLFTSTPTNTIGNDGDFGFDYSTLNGTILFKNGGNWLPATNANLVTVYGAGASIATQGTVPIGAVANTFWYKTTSSSGGNNMNLTRYRAVDNVWVTIPIIRQPTSPIPNQYTIWEDISQISTTGNHPLYIGTGLNFIPLPIIIQNVAPVTDPVPGTLWYNDTFTDFALYVEGTDFGYGNQWVPITTTTVLNPTAQQKVISGSPPQFPNPGAIWVDVSTPENLDNFPVMKQWQGSQWIDITSSILMTDQDPNATVVVNGTYWLNLGESLTTNTVKIFTPGYTPVTVEMVGGSYVVVPQQGNNWAPDTGGLFGRQAVRQMVVRSMQSAYNSNNDIRDESVYFQLITSPGYPELYDSMLQLNTDQGNTSFMICDTPKYMVPDGITSGRNVTVAEWASNSNNVVSTGESGFSSAGSPYAGFWYPWGIASDLSGNNDFVPPSHAVLRMFAYSDQMAAPWFPPAGFTRGMIDSFQSVGYLNNDDVYTPLRLIRTQRDLLQLNKINPLAYIPNRGLCAYGQMTFSPISSAMDRVNVARLVAKMQYDLKLLLQPFLFELNDSITRRAALITTQRYLAGLTALRALYDYAVQCDDNNNTPALIDEHQLWVDVAIKPEKSIEFIYVPITILNTGDSFPF